MKNIKKILSNIFLYNVNEKYDFSLPETISEKEEFNNYIPPLKNNSKTDKGLLKNVCNSLNKNLEQMKIVYNSLINSDVKIREFTLIAQNKEYKSFLFYLDGMTDSKIINDFILKPLMLRNSSNTHENEENDIRNSIIITQDNNNFNLEKYIFSSLMPQNSVKEIKSFNEIYSEINSGNCALFIDTLNSVFSIDSKGYKQRSISEPSNEIVIRGSQEAFVENIRTNTSLLRRFVNNENLIIESTTVGKITKTQIAICYLKNIANTDLIAEVKYRINNIDIDYLVSSGQLEQFIQDNNNVIFPQILSTERPDKASNNILNGRVIILVNDTPYALIVPATFFDFLSSPEDRNLPYQYSNLARFVRIIALFFALLLPGLYVAITNYHHELIPTELLFTMVAARNSVPFPIIVEILIMEISFELIREAGIRVPSPLGPTIRHSRSINFR